MLSKWTNWNWTIGKWTQQICCKLKCVTYQFKCIVKSKSVLYKHCTNCITLQNVHNPMKKCILLQEKKYQKKTEEKKMQISATKSLPNWIVTSSTKMAISKKISSSFSKVHIFGWHCQYLKLIQMARKSPISYLCSSCIIQTRFRLRNSLHWFGSVRFGLFRFVLISAYKHVRHEYFSSLTRLLNAV